MGRENVTLGDCYDTGMAYTLGYEANGEIELDTKFFTSLDTGADGGVMKALTEHRRQFDPNRDIKKFIVSLKPIRILNVIPDHEDYKIDDNSECDHCGLEDRMGGEVLCMDCLDDESDEVDYDDDICFECGLDPDTCGCWDDEFDQENIADTFHPMNAFDRARWLKARGEI